MMGRVGECVGSDCEERGIENSKLQGKRIIIGKNRSGKRFKPSLK
jgi:hypothetical protein